MPEVRTDSEYRKCARELTGLHACVRAAQKADRPDRVNPVLEIVLAQELDRVPPEVLRRLGVHDFGIVDVQRAGSPEHIIAIAV